MSRKMAKTMPECKDSAGGQVVGRAPGSGFGPAAGRSGRGVPVHAVNASKRGGEPCEVPPYSSTMGETRVDLLRLLEDLRDAYPGSLEETILTELVARRWDGGRDISP